MDNYTQEEYLEAKNELKELISFYWNLGSYIVIISLLFALDYWLDGSPGIDWAYWPLLGWGIGLIFHAIGVFGFFQSKQWEEKKIKKIMEKNQNQRKKFNP